MVFSTNQVRQLYVAKEIKTEANATVTNNDNEGTIAFKATKDGEHVYFMYRGADNLMRSDLIDVKNILYAKRVESDADAQNHALKEVTVKLDADVNGGNPIPGQDYILRIVINPYVGMSDEEPYIKYGAVHASRTTTPAKFYTKLAASLYKNFSRELGKMLEFTIAGKVVDRVSYDENMEEVLWDKEGNKIAVAEAYADGIKITEVEQEWTLGIKEQTYVNFTVIPTTVTFDGDEVTWGTTETTESATVRNNGRKIADLEYFCMGERGDQYRNIGWPNSIPTKYLVDPEAAYDVFEIHFAYVGPNEGPQRSERDLTIVTPKANRDDLKTLVEQFTTATRVSVGEITE